MLPNLILRHLAAARLMPRQLSRKPANLKKAIRDIERSSKGVREDANIQRRTAGVTGILLDDSGGGTSETPFDEDEDELDI